MPVGVVNPAALVHCSAVGGIGLERDGGVGVEDHWLFEGIVIISGVP